MDTQERELLNEIKSLYDKLEQNVYGEYRGAVKIGEPGAFYQIYAKKLLDKVSDLQRNFHPDYLSEADVSALRRTIDKEVEDVECCHQKALKPNASQRKKDAVCGAIRKANEQIKLDLFRLFKEIEQL